MGDIDFEEQLRLQELEKQTEPNEPHIDDKDGPIYEWDHKLKAYVPKIDADFIAQYQMNYGFNNQESEKPAPPESTDSQAVDSAENEKQWKEYLDYCKKYYEEQMKLHPNSDEKDGDYKDPAAVAAAAASESDPSSYYYYYHYYHYYYYQQQEEEQGQPSKGQDDSDSSEESKVIPTFGQMEEPKTQQSGTSEATDTTTGPDKRKVDEAGWFDVEDKHNLNVYVSNLPLDITDEEYAEFMKKCGLIMFDPKKRTPKLKLYKDENGQPKGDGLCCYIKPESVSLALQILDGYDVRGKKIKVEMAKFEMKGDFDPAKKKRKLSNKEKRKMKERQEKLFDWRPEPMRGARFKREKTVVLQNMFEPKEFDDEPTLLQELREDVRVESSKFGDVRKVTIYDRNPSGVITVTFREPEEADECITALNGRWFAQKRISAETWDGKTKYDVIETEEERLKRLNKWTDFLMTGVEGSSGADADKTPSTSEKDTPTPLATSGDDPNAEDLTPKSPPNTSATTTAASSSSSPVPAPAACWKPIPQEEESSGNGSS